MRNIVVTWILGLVLLQALGCDCGSDLQEATSRADLYFVGSQPTPPDAGEFLDIPEDGIVAINYGTTDIGTVKRRYLFIRNTGQSELEVLNIAYDPTSGLDPFHLRCQSGDQFVSDCSGPMTYQPNVKDPIQQNLIVHGDPSQEGTFSFTGEFTSSTEISGTFKYFKYPVWYCEGHIGHATDTGTWTATWQASQITNESDQ